MKIVRELEVGEVWWMLQTHFMDHFVRSCSDNLHHLWTWTWQLLSQWLLFVVPSPEFDVDMLFDAGFASKFYKLNEQMTTSMSWSFPLLARQVIHAADPPRSNPSWASQGVVTWEQNISRLCDKWCEKEKVLRLMWSRCLKTQRFPQHPWTKWFVQLHTVTTLP